MGELDIKTLLPGACAQPFDIDYSPPDVAGSGSSNTMFFSVQQGAEGLAVFATCCKAVTGEANAVSVVLTDPKGNKFSSGIALKMLESPRREIIVENPLPGRWVLEVCAAGTSCAGPGDQVSPSRRAQPGPVNGIIVTQKAAQSSVL